MLNGTPLISVHLLFLLPETRYAWFDFSAQGRSLHSGRLAGDDQIILVNLLFMFLWLLQERKQIRKTICRWNRPSNPSILGFKLVNWQSFCDWSSTRLILWEKQTKFQTRARLLFDSYVSWHDFIAGISFIEELDICTQCYEEVEGGSWSNEATRRLN